MKGSVPGPLYLDTRDSKLVSVCAIFKLFPRWEETYLPTDSGLFSQLEQIVDNSIPFQYKVYGLPL